MLLSLQKEKFVTPANFLLDQHWIKCFLKNWGKQIYLILGTIILADKIPHTWLSASRSNLNIPPFAVKPQFTPEESRCTTQIAKRRIHVEGAIQRIKIFLILNCISHKYVFCNKKISSLCFANKPTKGPLIKKIYI